MNNLFSYQGRLNRSNYIGVCLAIVVVGYAISFVAGIFVGLTGGSEAVAKLLGFMIGILMTVATGFQTVKRLHDLDRPGWHYWLLLVPFYNLYLSLVLLFQKSNGAANTLGTDSLEPRVTSDPRTWSASG